MTFSNLKSDSNLKTNIHWMAAQNANAPLAGLLAKLETIGASETTHAHQNKIVLRLDKSVMAASRRTGSAAVAVNFSSCFVNINGVVKWPNDPSSTTAATRRADCNRDGPPPFAAAHG